MTYSQEQLDRIRAALQAYRDEPQSETGKGLTWKEVAEKISENAGLPLSPDALRMFVEGLRGGPRTPRPEALEAITSFLMRPDIAKLSQGDI